MEELLYEIRDGIGFVTLNRPQARNALTFPMYERLREIALGAWEGKTREDLIAEYPAEWEAWTRRPSWDLVPGGEGAGRFEARVLATLAHVQADLAAGDVLCLTHGGVIQVLLGSVVAPGRGSDGLFPFVIENCSLTVLQRTGSRTVVISVNDVCHLS